MSGLLAQLFVVLAASLTIGIVLGFTLGAHHRDPRPEAWAGAASSEVEEPPDATPHQVSLIEVVEREAALIEALARADDDLHARARELAIANEEITCLLEQLHEARHPPSASSTPRPRDDGR